jgi:hypothetical protein
MHPVCRGYFQAELETLERLQYSLLENATPVSENATAK